MQIAINKNEEIKRNVPKYLPIFIPILIEQFFQTLIGNIDVLVLSQYSDESVAAVGLANQILVIGIMILGIVSIGTMIILNQLSIINDENKIKPIIVSSVYLNLIISFTLFIILLFFGEKLLMYIQTPNELIKMSYSFLKIVGFSLIFQGLMSSFASIFRSYAYVKSIMKISIITNILNLIGNCIVVLTPINILGKGIVGIANSTLISRAIGAVIYIYLFCKLFKEYNLKIFMGKLDLNSIKMIFKLGLPSGMESISYNISQTILTGFIAGFGTVMLTAKIYTQTMTSVIFTVSCAISMAIQIIIGKLIGSNLKKNASKYGVEVLYKGVCVIALLSMILSLFSGFIVRFFTTDNNIASIVILLVMLSIALEPARAANCILISNLNAAGEVKFPVIVGMITTYLITIPLSYIIGVKLGYGICGIWVVAIIDEWIRATIFYFRWKKGKWMDINILV